MSGLRKIFIVFLFLLAVVATAVSLHHTQAAGGPSPQAYLPLILAGCDEYFFDDFSDPNSGWPVGPVILNSQQLGSLEYLNEEYHIHSDTAGAGYLFRPLAPALGYENYTVAADARFDVPTTDGLVGLIFGGIIEGNEVPRYYLFEIEPETQEFRLVRREYGVSTDIISYTVSAAINTGAAVNHLEVTRIGDQITLAVNDTTLGTWADSGLTGPGYTGLGLRTRTSVTQADGYFDNFHLYYCAPAAPVSNTAVFNRAERPSAVDAFSAFDE